MKKITLIWCLLIASFGAFATGEPATSFNIFVPPNNDPVRRDVCLIITAIYDSTYFNIQDDGADGDTDDSRTGYLMAGQSYVTYIRDNGINDDAQYASGGTLKQDGDYFIITANKLILASQSTDSDWQHDWVPSIDGTGIGHKFLIYAPKITSSPRDVNVMAYEDSTMVTIKKVSPSAKTTTGFTTVDMNNNTSIVAQIMLAPGKDLIYFYKNGRDLLTSGHTYVIESNKPVTVQYGSLFGNERDGGGYVPSSNGSCSGDKFYFAVPYQATTEQEIRIVSWSDANNVVLERYLNGAWINVKNFNGLNFKKAGEWIGKTFGQTYPTIFRVSCTPGKKVSVFEANWLETGSPGTSDIATMASAANGKASGKEFLVYLAPPGNEDRVTDPFTRTKLGGQFTHAYIFANMYENTTVTVKDAFTNGQKINRTYQIAAGRYVDCRLSLQEWRSIYNGTGTTSAGPERPYLLIESTQEVSVMITNFNDNWMMYFGSSQVKAIEMRGSTSTPIGIPGATIIAYDTVSIGSTLKNTQIDVLVGSGLTPIQSTMVIQNNNQTINGTISSNSNQSKITFPRLAQVNANTEITIQTVLTPEVIYNNGTMVANNTVVTLETVVTGTTNNNELQQSVQSKSITNNSANTSNLLFSRANLAGLTTDKTSSWTCNWVDYDNDGDDDLFMTELSKAKPNIMYKNNGAAGFTRVSSGIFTSDNDRAESIAAAFADVNNDGDLDFVVANNGKPQNFYYSNQNGNFTRVLNNDIVNPISYFHGASYADYDNDGNLDLFLSDYMPTAYNRLMHNEGNGNFVEVKNTPISLQASYSLIGAWCDYDKDGDQDLFVANDKGNKNALYENKGNGVFELVNNVISNDYGNSVSAAWGDYDNDRDMDLYVTNSSSDAFLYQNNGNGTFTKITNKNITDLNNSSAHGTNWVDVDNDGDLDLYIVANNKPKILFMNDGSGNFTKNTDEIITNSEGSSYSQAWSDFDKDGDLDLFVVTLNNEINYLFTNNGTNNKYLEVNLEGNRSNKDAIGAKIFVCTAAAGQPKWQMREINSQSGFGGQNSYTQHFGLGKNTVVDTLRIYWPSGQIQTLVNVPSNQIMNISEPNGITITGKAFYDLNNNCTFDNQETVLANQKVKISPFNTFAYTNSNGDYQTIVPTQNFGIEGVGNNYWLANCATQNVSANISDAGKTIRNLDIAFTSAQPSADVSVVCSPTALRRGFKNEMKIMVVNEGNSISQNDTLFLSLPAELHLQSSSLAYNGLSIKGEYYWLINSIYPGQVIDINLVDSVKANAALGNEVKIQARISVNSNDNNASNNLFEVIMPIVGSIDPNDIAVFPKGEGKLGYISSNQVLTYHIRFENMGNYYASMVFIEDELPEGLDMSTLQVIGTSHPFFTSVNGNKVLFSNTNLHLPCSQEDSILSQGFVRFQISPKKDIAAGTILNNKAAIIFDYNEPVITNTVVNTIKYKVNKDELYLFPNPCNGIINATLLSNLDKNETKEIIEKIEIETTSGISISKINYVETNLGDISTELLPKGMYILKAITATGIQYTSKFVKE